LRDYSFSKLNLDKIDLQLLNFYTGEVMERWEIISNIEIQKIHESSLDILSTVGIKVTHPEIRQLLLESGAKEGNNFVIFLPTHLIEAALKKAPPSVHFADQIGNIVEVKSGVAPLFWTGNALYYSRGSERKELTRERYAEFCRVANQLPHLHAICATSLSDYPPQARDFIGFRTMAEYTQKHLRAQIFTPQGIQAILEMTDVLLEGKLLREYPVFSIGVTAESPLQWGDFALEVMRISSGYGIPLGINSEVISGATAPVTLAGSLVLANAEVLSGITIAQLLETGRPVVFNLGFSHIFDMKFLETLTGAPEQGLLGAAGGAIAHFHKLPSQSWMSTESKIPDGQASYEKTLLGLLHALGGVNIIWGVGNLESTLTISPEQAVIDDEIVAGILRAWKGIKVEEDRLALSVIKELGQKADYLKSEHTLNYFREELLMTKLLSRERRGPWEKQGCKELTQRAQDRLQTFLKAPPSEHLTGSQKEKLKLIEKRWLEKVS
jgi:trimethylamine--corrinoid protein Co-methyltransferase